jgi:hypothetical protein
MGWAVVRWSVWFGDPFRFSGDKANDFLPILKRGIALDCHCVIKEPTHLLFVAVLVGHRWLGTEASGDVIQRIGGEMPDLVVNAVRRPSGHLAVICGYDEHTNALLHRTES